jgi:hypothetical protein
MIDGIIDLIHTGLAVPVGGPQYRVLFDVQDPGAPILGYPVVLAMHWLPIIFENTDQTIKLFHFFAIIAILAIPLDIFSPCFTGLLAVLVTQYAFMKRWHRFTLKFPHLENDPLWGTLIGNLTKFGIEPYTYAILRARAKHSSLKERVDTFVNDLGMKLKATFNGMVELIMDTANDNRSALDVVLGNSRSVAVA